MLAFPKIREKIGALVRHFQGKLRRPGYPGIKRFLEPEFWTGVLRGGLASLPSLWGKGRERPKSLFRVPAFWIVFGLIFIGCVSFTFRYASRAFPFIALDIKMDRGAALRSARELAGKFDWGPEGFRQAASFDLDRKVRNFVELEAGGPATFRKMLRGKLYSPYTWRVRHFQEGQTRETFIYFTPAGKPDGFEEVLPEDEPGASLSATAARTIAEIAGREEWGVNFAAYELVESSEEVRPGGRTDHAFVYERTGVRLGEGRYRLRLVVGGDRLTALVPFVKVPEAFSRRYQQMRSANNTIASLAGVATGALYVLGGVLLGLFFLFRWRMVIWRPALFWGIAIAALQLLEGINQLPLNWMGYDTALSTQVFLLHMAVRLLAQFIFLSILLTLSFMAAEGLSRKAFSHHVQFWRLWSPGVANSPAVLGRTTGSYLLVGFLLAFEVGFYLLAHEKLGWWTPSEALVEPDVLATYFPWLSPLALSLQAGFWEECLFRAIPLAGAALLGQRFGRRRAWIAAALVIQAVIFGAAHANYPTQPAYARLVELFIPSLVWGLIYLYFGLLPAVILHFGFDGVLSSLPLFISSGAGIWMDRILVVALMLIPLGVVLVARRRSGRWVEIRNEDYNRAWKPLPRTEVGQFPSAAVPSEAAPAGVLKLDRGLLAAGALGLLIWFLSGDFQNDASALKAGRHRSESEAREFLAGQGIELPESWQILSSVRAMPDQQDRFVWQEGGENIYRQLLGQYLGPPCWEVRFARFSGDVAERAEEYRVFVKKEGEVFRFWHKLPEARAGASLSEKEALTLAESVLRKNYRFEPSRLKKISAEASRLPARTDWTFTFADIDNYPLSQGEARIEVEIAGNEVVDSYRYVHVPEEWARRERNRRMLAWMLQAFCVLGMALVFLAGAISGIVSWSGRRFSSRSFLIFFFLLLGIQGITLVNGWPAIAAGFSTAEPLRNQILTVIAYSLLGAIFTSAGLALIVGFLQNWIKPRLPGKRLWFLWLAGFSPGILIAALLALMGRFAPSLAPRWAEYEALESHLPFLGAGLGFLEGYIIMTCVFLFVFTAASRFTGNWTQRKRIFSILLILLGLITAGVRSLDSVWFWVVSGLLVGVVLLIAYRFIFCFQPALVPAATGAVASLAALKQGILNAYPQAVWGAVLGIILIGLCSFYWVRMLSGLSRNA